MRTSRLPALLLTLFALFVPLRRADAQLARLAGEEASRPTRAPSALQGSIRSRAALPAPGRSGKTALVPASFARLPLFPKFPFPLLPGANGESVPPTLSAGTESAAVGVQLFANINPKSMLFDGSRRLHVAPSAEDWLTLQAQKGNSPGFKYAVEAVGEGTIAGYLSKKGRFPIPYLVDASIEGKGVQDAIGTKGTLSMMPGAVLVIEHIVDGKAIERVRLTTVARFDSSYKSGSEGKSAAYTPSFSIARKSFEYDVTWFGPRIRVTVEKAGMKLDGVVYYE